ncbi:XapX domain-containing protein [Lysinibacillus sp. NPDC097279]|uniref:XapX domain-containing protein n=1 Tax=Lysinibacillus sp. NPDC097279 TaxID=3364143 RepID=UPI00382E78BB
MRDYLLSLAGGLIVGILFSLVKLPLPAPPLVGIFGMVGIFLGGVLMDSLFKFLKEKRKVST